MALANAGSSPEHVPRPRRLRLDLTTPSLLGLPLAWLAAFFLVPIAIVAAYSFDVYSLNPGPHGFTLTAWHDFLTSYLLRVLAWKVILGNQGAFNTFLFWTGLRSPDHPLSQLLYSRFAVMLVLGYIWLPFVALPIFVSLESLDRRL